MKLSELSRYWAAKELTRIERHGNSTRLQAPFACPAFTIRLPAREQDPLRVIFGNQPPVSYPEVKQVLDLKSGTWIREAASITLCCDLPKGATELRLG